MNITIEINDKILREFGFIFSTGIVLIFGLFFPWILDKPWPTWPWILAVVFTLPAVIYPRVLKPAYLLWMKIGMALGWLNSRIILGFVFYIFFVPVSILFKIVGNDPMKRKLDTKIESYRVQSTKHEPERMESPF